MFTCAMFTTELSWDFINQTRQKIHATMDDLYVHAKTNTSFQLALMQQQNTLRHFSNEPSIALDHKDDVQNQEQLSSDSHLR